MRLGPWMAKGFIGVTALVMLFLALVQARIIILPAYYDPYSAPDLRQPPYWLTSSKLQVLDRDPQACEDALTQAGLQFPLIAPTATDSELACYLENTVMLKHLSRASLKPEQTRCAIAARLYMWERHILQPTAQAVYGEGIKEITHFGSYSCRTIHNSSHLSEHATANALDISGLVLKSGRTISVKHDWQGAAKDQAFLHQIRDGLCTYFNLTLSPDYNTDHADHFHVDMGRVRDCR